MTPMKRRSIEVEGLAHGTIPIPAASKIGPFIATGGIRGVDRHTHVMPPDLGGQVRLMFENLQTILEAAGSDCDAILKLTIWILNDEARGLINQEWLKRFPDAQARPARHILKYALEGSMQIQCEALAIAREA